MAGRSVPQLSSIRTSLGLAVMVYVVIAWICFTGPVHPIFLYLKAGERADWVYWQAATVFAGMLGTVVLAILLAVAGRKLIVLFPAVFLAVLLPATVFFASFLLERERTSVIERFAPDRVMVNSLWQSLHQAPADYQFFLHAAALKDCQAYAWSYREMDFYPLRPDTAVNVLPRGWAEDCGIVRSNR